MGAKEIFNSLLDVLDSGLKTISEPFPELPLSEEYIKSQPLSITLNLLEKNKKMRENTQKDEFDDLLNKDIDRINKKISKRSEQMTFQNSKHVHQILKD